MSFEDNKKIESSLNFAMKNTYNDLSEKIDNAMNKTGKYMNDNKVEANKKNESFEAAIIIIGNAINNNKVEGNKKFDHLLKKMTEDKLEAKA